MSDQIVIEVAFATPERQMIISIKVKNGITVKEVIELSGILNELHGISLDDHPVGIF